MNLRCAPFGHSPAFVRPVNALGGAQTNPGTIDALLAAFTLPDPTVMPTAATAAFVNMINLMLDADEPQASSQQQTASSQAATSAVPTASPTQIAESLIRSMLGGSGGSGGSAAATQTTATLATKQSAAASNPKQKTTSTVILPQHVDPAPVRSTPAEPEAQPVSSSLNPVLQKVSVPIQQYIPADQASPKGAMKSAAIRFVLGSAATLSNAAMLASNKTTGQAIATPPRASALHQAATSATSAPALPVVSPMPAAQTVPAVPPAPKAPEASAALSIPATPATAPTSSEQPLVAADPQQSAAPLPAPVGILVEDQQSVGSEVPQPAPQPKQSRSGQNSSPADAITSSVPMAAPAILSIAPQSPVTNTENAPISTAESAQEPTAFAAPLPLPAKNQSQSPIAFQAILTPIKDATAPTLPQAGAEVVHRAALLTIPPAPGLNALLTTVLAPSVAPPSQQAALNPASLKSTPSPIQSDTREGPDNSASEESPQQDDTQPAPVRSTAASDPKAKIADIQQGDNATPAPAAQQNHTFEIASAAPPIDQTRAEPSAEPARPEVPVPFQSAAETLRTVESSLPSTPLARTGTAQEIAIRIAQPDTTPVDLRVTERDGEVHVDVRTMDPVMQTSLQQNLGTLANSLDRAGYHSETFTPAGSSVTGRGPASGEVNQNQGDQNPSQHPSQQRGGAGDFSGGRRQQQQQKRANSWLEELENQQ